MARFCIAGCGTELKKDDGLTDYDRQFCSEKCRSNDRKQKLRDQRAQMKTKTRCSKCTQPILKPQAWEKLRLLAAEAGIDL
jgi:hypothetical protein